MIVNIGKQYLPANIGYKFVLIIDGIGSRWPSDFYHVRQHILDRK